MQHGFHAMIYEIITTILFITSYILQKISTKMHDENICLQHRCIIFT